MLLNSSNRDVRIDFLRGFCLLEIYTRHIDPNQFRVFTPSGIGFSDAAEAFVFLSGLVCGAAYSKSLKLGFIFCQLKAARRCGQIYVAHVFTIFFCLAIFPLFFEVTNWKALEFFADAKTGIRRVFLLSLFPYSYGILCLYIFLLAPLPWLLLIAKKAGTLPMIAGSYVVYAGAQMYPEIFGLPAGWEYLFFNPFAWQFLFVIGAVLGSGSSNYLSRIPQGRVSVGFALVALAFLGAAKLSFPDSHEWLEWVSSDPPSVGKANLEPLRLMQFFLSAYVCWRLLPQSAGFYQTRVLLGLVRCGQFSLAVFCASLVLTSMANDLLHILGDSWLWQLAANVLGWLALFLLAGLLQAMSQIFSKCTSGKSHEARRTSQGTIESDETISATTTVQEVSHRNFVELQKDCNVITSVLS